MIGLHGAELCMILDAKGLPVEASTSNSGIQPSFATKDHSRVVMVDDGDVTQGL